MSLSKLPINNDTESNLSPNPFLNDDQPYIKQDQSQNGQSLTQSIDHQNSPAPPPYDAFVAYQAKYNYGGINEAMEKMNFCEISSISQPDVIYHDSTQNHDSAQNGPQETSLIDQNQLELQLDELNIEESVPNDSSNNSSTKCSSPKSSGGNQDHPNSGNHSPLESSSVTSTPKRMKTDVLSKRVMRAFRDHLKSKFQDMHGSKYYYWIPTTLRKATKSFFTTKEFQFSTTEYRQYEFVFIKLIHNSKKGEKTVKLAENGMEYEKLLIDIFGAKPNAKNLKKFFQIPLIQQLWWGKDGFLSTMTYLDIVNIEFDTEERKSFLKFIEKSSPPGQTFY